MGESKVRFKKGDKVMFLGIFDHNLAWELWARDDDLIPMAVYEVEYSPLRLKGKRYPYIGRYFQKI